MGFWPSTRIHPGAAGAAMRSRPGTKSYPHIHKPKSPLPQTPTPFTATSLCDPPDRPPAGRAGGLTTNHLEPRSPWSSLARSRIGWRRDCSPSVERLLAMRGWHRLVEPRAGSSRNNDQCSRASSLARHGLGVGEGEDEHGAWSRADVLAARGSRNRAQEPSAGAAWWLGATWGLRIAPGPPDARTGRIFGRVQEPSIEVHGLAQCFPPVCAGGIPTRLFVVALASLDCT